MKTQVVKFGAAAVLALSAQQIARAGAHTWDVVEVFSNADGTIQFIEIREMNNTPGETFLAGRTITSDALGNSFTIPANLPAGSSANKRLLFGTAAYAALPGVPAPDYILPVAPFFRVVGGDTVRYNPYDALVIPAGALPTDCVQSFNDNGVIATNSPTNFAGQTGTVVCPPPPVECEGDIAPQPPDGTVNVDDLLVLLGAWGSDDKLADLNGSGNVDVDDLLDLLGNWGPCKK